MDVLAHARFIRMAPRKVRLVTNLVKGLRATVAITQLKFLQKEAARPVRKVIESARANAVHNHKLDASQLWIRSIT
ncbi:50S ribosomal protein L22, partial [Candidatus Uhrbacteria bacterium]|nr:50S ribosomal protein L22 [Candidatus Uhrbacteria bacterium]